MKLRVIPGIKYGIIFALFIFAVDFSIQSIYIASQTEISEKISKSCRNVSLLSINEEFIDISTLSIDDLKSKERAIVQRVANCYDIYINKRNTNAMLALNPYIISVFFFLFVALVFKVRSIIRNHRNKLLNRQ